MAKIELVAQANLPTEFGLFKIVGFEFPDTKKEHVALVLGDISHSEEPVLARIGITPNSTRRSWRIDLSP